MALANITKPTGTKTTTFGSMIFGSPSTAATTAAPATAPAANPNTLLIGGNSNFVTTNTASKDPGAAMGPYQDPAKNLVTTVAGGADALKVDNTKGVVADTGPYQDPAKNVVTTAAPASTYTPIVNPFAGKTSAELATIAADRTKQSTTSTYTPTAQKTEGYTAGGYDTTAWDIDPEEIAKSQTVQGQLQGIIAANSPLIQLAEAQAKQQMNQRGLLNTSMALGAGQEAVIKQALPIATQDATLFANQAKYNAEAASAAAQFKATAENRAAEFGAAAKNTAFAADKAASDAALQFEAAAKNASSANYTKDLNTTMSQMMDQSLKIGLADADNTTKLKIQQIDADTRKYLIDTEATYKNQMQASSSANDLYVNITKNIATIMADPNLDTEAKQAAVNIQKGYLTSGLAIIGQTSGVEGIDSLVDFSDEEGAAEAVKPKPLTAGANFQTIAKQYGDVLNTSSGATVDKDGAAIFKYTDPISKKTANFKLPTKSYYDEEKGQVVDDKGAVISIPSGLIAGEITKEKLALLSPGLQAGDLATEIDDYFAGTGLNTTGAVVAPVSAKPGAFSFGEIKLKSGTVIPAGAVVVGDKIYKPDGTLVTIKAKDKI